MSQPEKNHKLDARQRRFVLRALGEFRSTEWIVQKLQERWGITRSPHTIDCGYRWNRQHKAKIEAYRAKYLAMTPDHPLSQRAVLLDYIQQGLDTALAEKDIRGLSALIRQIAEMNSFNAPSQLEITQTGTGKSFEDLLASLLPANQHLTGCNQ